MNITVDKDKFLCMVLLADLVIQVVEARTEEGIDVESPVQPACKALPMFQRKGG